MKKKTEKTEVLNTQELFHEPSQQTLDKEEWGFNRETTIQRLVALSKTRAERHTKNHAIHEEDRIPERVVKNPLRHNPFVDFFDETEFALSELSRFCDRLAVRRKTLKLHRVKVASADWSSEQKQEIALIDEALELIDYTLGNPTAPYATLKKRIEHYESCGSGSSHSSPEVPQPDKAPSENHLVYAAPPKGNDIAKFICKKGNKLANQIGATPSPVQLWDFIVSDFKKEEGVEVSATKHGLTLENTKLTRRAFRWRLNQYLKHARSMTYSCASMD